MLEGFLKLLPSIASHPLAIAAYVCLAGIWLLWTYRRFRSNDFLRALATIPKEQREAFCRNSGFKYDELAQLPERQRLNLLTRRYLLLAFIVTVVALLLFGLAVLLVSSTNKKEGTKVAQTIAQALKPIEEGRRNLQAKLDEEQRRSIRLVAGVQGARESASTSARLLPNPELKRLGEKLEQILQDFDSQFGSSGHSSEVDFALRRARATAANARGDYVQALELVTEADAEASIRRVESQNQEAFASLNIRADAFYGQRQWLLALTNYSRMLTLRSDNLSAFFGEGKCHWQLGTSIEGADATRHLDSAVRTFRAAAEVCHREQLSQGWAVMQNGLGNALIAQAVRSVKGPKRSGCLTKRWARIARRSR
jgi:tetratricopeptide (TPR) repeat protein